MALDLLDGTVAALDFTTGEDDDSWKCVANYVSADLGNELFDFTTFCSTGWRKRTRGMKQLIGRIAGFLSKGDPVSNPSTLFAGTGPTPFVMTFDTGCTVTGDLQPRNIHAGMAAAGASELGLDWESYGAVTFAWVTA